MYEFKKKEKKENYATELLTLCDTRKIIQHFFSNFKMVFRTLVSGSSSPGSSPGRGHCVVFLGKTPNSHSASLHPGV